MPNPQQLFQSAIEHHQAGRLAEAGELYRQILAETPRQPDAMHLLGVVAHQMGDDAQAVDLIGQSIALNPNSPEAHSNLGISLRESGRVDESIAACRRAIELRPDFADAHSNLSLALADKGQFEQAITAARKAIELAPKHVEAHGNLGNALRNTGNLPASIVAHQQALALNPNYAYGHNNLGLSLRENGQIDEAIAAYQKAIALRPDFSLAYTNLGSALSARGDLDAAVNAHRQAIALRPDSAEAINNLANTLRKKKAFDAAIDAFNEAIALRPNYADAHSNLGLVFVDMGRFEDAVASFRRAIDLKPNFPEAYNNLGGALKETGEFGQAIAAFNKALELRPGYMSAHGNLCAAIIAKAKLDKVLRAYQAEGAFVPRLSEPRHALGNISIESRGQNLVFGMAWNLKVGDVEVFTKSLRRHYDGDAMMLVTSQGSRELVEYLQSAGIVPIYFDAAIWMGIHVQLARYVRYAETLRSVGKQYHRILLTDVSDVVFQADPFSDLPDGELLCYLEADGRTIDDCQANSGWIQQIYGPEMLDKLRNFEISCSGTTIGSHRNTLHYLDRVLEEAKPALFDKISRFQYGHDQGIHNYLLRCGGLPEAQLIPNARHVYTVGLVPDQQIRLGKNGTILTPDERLCPVVHQYTYKAPLDAHVRAAFRG